MTNRFTNELISLLRAFDFVDYVKPDSAGKGYEVRMRQHPIRCYHPLKAINQAMRKGYVTHDGDGLYWATEHGKQIANSDLIPPFVVDSSRRKPKEVTMCECCKFTPTVPVDKERRSAGFWCFWCGHVTYI